ncbi:orf43 [Artaxa digramma nucleopolyhedrovirus]|uniref:Orf43 n=1 Tax=Artaxa digramma nucleopolyhedrovirus TaxID=3070910 RepID=A0AAE6R601_9ABAC|nr:orf43 [Euproctis digramma nucleopolyhedrovirus]QHB21702.1 orf43 [Artaxa digramma nucleopolyhedrovirus]
MVNCGDVVVQPTNRCRCSSDNNFCDKQINDACQFVDEHDNKENIIDVQLVNKIERHLTLDNADRRRKQYKKHIKRLIPQTKYIGVRRKLNFDNM